MSEIDPLYIIIAAINNEYDMDECCDYYKINRMIEEAAQLIAQRIGGDDRLRKLADLYKPSTMWGLI